MVSQTLRHIRTCTHARTRAQAERKLVRMWVSLSGVQRDGWGQGHSASLETGKRVWRLWSAHSYRVLIINLGFDLHSTVSDVLLEAATSQTAEPRE